MAFSDREIPFFFRCAPNHGGHAAGSDPGRYLPKHTRFSCTFWEPDPTATRPPQIPLKPYLRTTLLFTFLCHDKFCCPAHIFRVQSPQLCYNRQPTTVDIGAGVGAGAELDTRTPPRATDTPNSQLMLNYI